MSHPEFFLKGKIRVFFCKKNKGKVYLRYLALSQITSPGCYESFNKKSFIVPKKIGMKNV